MGYVGTVVLLGQSICDRQGLHTEFLKEIFFKWPKESHRTWEDNIMIHLR